MRTTKGAGVIARERHFELREWRKVEREIGTVLTKSLISQGFSESDIARLGPQAWPWVEGDEFQAILDELANYIAEEMVIRRAFHSWCSREVVPPKPKATHYGSNTIHLIAIKEAK